MLPNFYRPPCPVFSEPSFHNVIEFLRFPDSYFDDLQNVVWREWHSAHFLHNAKFALSIQGHRQKPCTQSLFQLGRV